MTSYLDKIRCPEFTGQSMSLLSSRNIFIFVVGIVILMVVVAVTLRLKLGDQMTLQSEPTPTLTPAPYTQSISQEKLVDGFPDIPIYPGATLEKSQSMSESEKNGFSATWTTTGGVRLVSQWYQDQLTEQGWTITEYPNDNDGERYIALEKDGQLLNITVERENLDKPTEIRIVFPLISQKNQK